MTRLETLLACLAMLTVGAVTALFVLDGLDRAALHQHVQIKRNVLPHP